MSGVMFLCVWILSVLTVESWGQGCPDLPPITPNGGPVTYPAGSAPWPVGTEARYTCADGYFFVLNSGAKRSTCGSDGQWITNPPSCGVPCPVFTVTNGIVEYTDGSYFLITDSPPGFPNTRATGVGSTITCASGYTLVGSSTGTCGFDGSWSNGGTTCQITCPPLNNPRNGTLSANSSSGIFLEGDTVTYSCDQGYHLVGEETRVCQSDRTWSHDPYCTDQAMVQLQFGPTSPCLQWSQEKAVTVSKYLRDEIHQVTLDGNEAIPLVNIAVGVFSCRTSKEHTTFRTTLTGTRETSAVQAAALLQKWVESAQVVRVEWYLVDISRSCPVSIGSLTEEECIEDQCVAVCRARCG